MANIGASVVGVSGGMVSVCDSLSRQAGDIENYITELDNLKNQLSNDWEGEDLDNFMAEFEGFKQKLNELPIVINSIAKWGMSIWFNRRICRKTLL